MNDRPGVLFLCRVGRAEASGNAGLRGANVAMSTWTARIRQISEVANQRGHAALAGYGILHRQVELRFSALRLSGVGVAPTLSAADGILVKVHRSAAVDDELLQHLVEQLGFHAQPGAKSFLLQRLFSQAAIHAIQFIDRWIIALEEKLMHLAIRVGVEQNGAAGEPIAPGAANLLVIRLQRTGK